jgi:hypothetical protein
MEVGHERHLQIAGFNCRDSFEGSGLGAAHDAWSEIDEVSAIVNNNRGGRAGTIGIGDGRAGTKEYYFRSGCGILLRFTLRSLWRSSYRQQHNSRYESNSPNFHRILLLNLTH